MADKLASSPNFFVDLVVNYRVARVVLSAHQLDLFTQLEASPGTAEQLAQRLGTDPRATTQLLRALASVGLLERDGETFRNAPLAREHLLPGRPGYLGSNLTYQELLWDGWSALTDTIRTGKPQTGLVELLTQGPANFSTEYLRSVDAVSRAASLEVAEISRAWPVSRVLDVGGGLGTYARAFAQAHPTAQVTLFDLPSTVGLSRKANEGHRAVVFREGNYLTDDFGEGFDLVLISHVTHDESKAVCQQLVSKAFSCLKPSGRLLIHDFVVSEGGTEPLFSAMFSVNMLVYTKGGQVYSVEEYTSMMVAAGFAHVTAQPILAHQSRHPSTLMVGTKPS